MEIVVYPDGACTNNGVLLLDCPCTQPVDPIQCGIVCFQWTSALTKNSRDFHGDCVSSAITGYQYWNNFVDSEQYTHGEVGYVNLYCDSPIYTLTSNPWNTVCQTSGTSYENSLEHNNPKGTLYSVGSGHLGYHFYKIPASTDIDKSSTMTVTIGTIWENTKVMARVYTDEAVSVLPSFREVSTGDALTATILEVMASSTFHFEYTIEKRPGYP